MEPYVALTSAAALLFAIGNVQSVFVVMIGVVALGESLAGREWIGIAVLVFGALLLASQPADAVPYAPETATSGAVAIGIPVLVVLLLLLADRSANRLRGELGLAVGAGCLFGLGDAMAKMGTEIVRGVLAGGVLLLARESGGEDARLRA